MSRGDKDSDSEEVPIVVEAYGFKVNVTSRPADLGEQPPASWRDVPARVNRHLMRIAVAPTRLIADLFEGVTRLIRGASRIPNAIAERVEHAHAAADADEGARQQAALEAMKRQPDPPAPRRARITSPLGELPEAPKEDKAARAIRELQAVLQKYKAKGVDAYIILSREGKPIIVIGTPPGSEQQVLDAIEDARGLLNEPPEESR